jgi:peroxiredoxin Q/BCP
MGKKYMGVSRSSYLIDPKGTIVKIYEKVQPKDHAKEVADDVARLSQ